MGFATFTGVEVAILIGRRASDPCPPSRPGSRGPGGGGRASGRPDRRHAGRDRALPPRRLAGRVAGARPHRRAGTAPGRAAGAGVLLPGLWDRATPAAPLRGAEALPARGEDGVLPGGELPPPGAHPGAGRAPPP